MITFTIDGREVTRAGERDARRRRQVRRRRDPRLLLRAQARPARRRLPHVPGRDRGHPEAADRLLHAGQGRHGRPHADRSACTRRSARWSSSCSINHPLDCPVCDKGGECPLQDITYGWGPGTSRFIEPKRHFRKPLELSPLIAIDRERCILCYRCVRFSQEISEDYQLILSERGAHSLRRAPSTATRTSARSAATSSSCAPSARSRRPPTASARARGTSRARARSARYCPSQCNVELTVRDDRVMRVLARDHEEVDDGWLCDKGRFAYQSMHVDERHHAAARARGRRADARQRGRRRSTPPRAR